MGDRQGGSEVVQASDQCSEHCGGGGGVVGPGLDGTF